MNREPLDNLVRVGKLKAELPTDAELHGLLTSGRARLEDARRVDLNIESRFDLAYNAAHALALLALRRAGYRSDHRYIVFQCLGHTLGLPKVRWRVLDQAHRARNLAEYEGHLDVSTALLQGVLATTQEVLERLERQERQ